MSDKCQGHCRVAIFPLFEVTKNRLSMPAGVLVITIRGTGGGWCCLQQPGVCRGTGVLAGVPL